MQHLPLQSAAAAAHLSLASSPSLATRPAQGRAPADGRPVLAGGGARESAAAGSARAGAAAPAEAGPSAEGNILGEISASIAESLSRRLPAEQYATWFRRVQLVRLDDRAAVFAVPNEFARGWIASYYLEHMAAAVLASLGVKRRVELKVDPEAALEHAWVECAVGAGLAAEAAAAPLNPQPERGSHGRPAAQNDFRRGDFPRSDFKRERATDPGGAHASAAERARAATFARPASPLHAHSDIVLNPRYTFENYVVGPCNRFAHAATMGSAEHPGKAYNPLFLHGHVGVGKTHLLQALCYMVLERQPGAKILYFSCETFVNHFINALENGDLTEFRDKYRSVDVLVVDDIHLLANKERTQEEFFHTFNTLYNAGKQIVLSSDSPPKDIPTLQDRLVSRFKWGMVTEVSPPCFETRVAIVKRKGRERGREVPDEVAQFIAEHIEENVRELEGAVTRLLGYAAITSQSIDVVLARNALADLIEVQRGTPTMDDILAVVTSHFSVKLSELQSKRRTAAIAYPRQVAMFLARRITRHSLEELGGFFGGRDHTTVLYGVDKIGKLCEKDPETAKTIGGMLEKLTGKR